MWKLWLKWGGALGVLLLAGCGHWPFGEAPPELLEAEPSQVAECQQVGALSETADAGRIAAHRARREMLDLIETRAQSLGATHLVWVYRTDQAMAARAFRCEE